MKNACWVLLALGALSFLCSIGAKVLPAHHLLSFLPIAWWRLAIAFAVLAMALKIVSGEERPGGLNA